MASGQRGLAGLAYLQLDACRSRRHSPAPLAVRAARPASGLLCDMTTTRGLTTSRVACSGRLATPLACTPPSPPLHVVAGPFGPCVGRCRTSPHATADCGGPVQIIARASAHRASTPAVADLPHWLALLLCADSVLASTPRCCVSQFGRSEASTPLTALTPVPQLGAQDGWPATRRTMLAGAALLRHPLLAPRTPPLGVRNRCRLLARSAHVRRRRALGQQFAARRASAWWVACSEALRCSYGCHQYTPPADTV